MTSKIKDLSGGQDPIQRIDTILDKEIWQVLRYKPHEEDCSSTERVVYEQTWLGPHDEKIIPPSGPCDCWRSRLASYLEEIRQLVRQDFAKRSSEEKTPDKESPRNTTRYEDSGSGCG